MIERFLALLGEATRRIPQHYFHLPVVGEKGPIYRERVYCYEFYHRLRTLLEQQDDLGSYVLGGEIDKQGHPIIRRCTPDFAFNVPRGMDGNLVVVEVKPVNAAIGGIRKDVDTFAHFFSRPVGYRQGVELVYGEDERKFSRFERLFREAGLERVQLFWHRHPGEGATRIL